MAPPLALWTAIPFVALLLCIAVLPILASRWWHRSRNQALVAAVFAFPVAAYLVFAQLVEGKTTVPLLAHEAASYVSFIVLLGSLYTIAGGIVLHGDFEPSPLTNAIFLGTGAILANAIGTTGASVLLIRPFLRINQSRRFAAHLPVFFIFIVSNLGGLLTPLGDPPLFLGFLNGVPFAWTFSLWPQWLLANGLVLTIFLGWEVLTYRRETESRVAKPARKAFRIEGLFNVALLGGVIVAVLIQGWLASPWGESIGSFSMFVMGLLSLVFTPRRIRQANGFTWAPIAEVALLFAGIFVTMIPPLAILSVEGPKLGLSQPWQFFWATGGLSAFLDNAPTYLSLATFAAGTTDIGELVRDHPHLLQAIVCGAVFMGALTYIGNGPNFMIKAMAEHAGFQTPGFFRYMGYAAVVLLPVFVVATLVFFW